MEGSFDKQYPKPSVEKQLHDLWVEASLLKEALINRLDKTQPSQNGKEMEALEKIFDDLKELSANLEHQIRQMSIVKAQRKSGKVDLSEIEKNLSEIESNVFNLFQALRNIQGTAAKELHMVIPIAPMDAEDDFLGLEKQKQAKKDTGQEGEKKDPEVSPKGIWMFGTPQWEVLQNIEKIEKKIDELKKDPLFEDNPIIRRALAPDDFQNKLSDLKKWVDDADEAKLRWLNETTTTIRFYLLQEEDRVRKAYQHSVATNPPKESSKVNNKKHEVMELPTIETKKEDKKDAAEAAKQKAILQKEHDKKLAKELRESPLEKQLTQELEQASTYYAKHHAERIKLTKQITNVLDQIGQLPESTRKTDYVSEAVKVLEKLKSDVNVDDFNNNFGMTHAKLDLYESLFLEIEASLVDNLPDVKGYPEAHKNLAAKLNGHIDKYEYKDKEKKEKEDRELLARLTTIKVPTYIPKPPKKERNWTSGHQPPKPQIEKDAKRALLQKQWLEKQKIEDDIKKKERKLKTEEDDVKENETKQQAESDRLEELKKEQAKLAKQEEKLKPKAEDANAKRKKNLEKQKAKWAETKKKLDAKVLEINSTVEELKKQKEALEQRKTKIQEENTKLQEQIRARNEKDTEYKKNRDEIAKEEEERRSKDKGKKFDKVEKKPVQTKKSDVVTPPNEANKEKVAPTENQEEALKVKTAEERKQARLEKEQRENKEKEKKEPIEAQVPKDEQTEKENKLKDEIVEQGEQLLREGPEAQENLEEIPEAPKNLLQDENAPKIPPEENDVLEQDEKLLGAAEDKENLLKDENAPKIPPEENDVLEQDEQLLGPEAQENLGEKPEAPKNLLQDEKTKKEQKYDEDGWEIEEDESVTNEEDERSESEEDVTQNAEAESAKEDGKSKKATPKDDRKPPGKPPGKTPKGHDDSGSSSDEDETREQNFVEDDEEEVEKRASLSVEDERTIARYIHNNFPRFESATNRFIEKASLDSSAQSGASYHDLTNDINNCQDLKRRLTIYQDHLKYFDFKSDADKRKREVELNHMMTRLESAIDDARHARTHLRDEKKSTGFYGAVAQWIVPQGRETLPEAIDRVRKKSVNTQAMIKEGGIQSDPNEDNLERFEGKQKPKAYRRLDTILPHKKSENGPSPDVVERDFQSLGEGFSGFDPDTGKQTALRILDTIKPSKPPMTSVFGKVNRPKYFVAETIESISPDAKGNPKLKSEVYYDKKQLKHLSENDFVVWAARWVNNFQRHNKQVGAVLEIYGDLDPRLAKNIINYCKMKDIICISLVPNLNYEPTQDQLDAYIDRYNENADRIKSEVHMKEDEEQELHQDTGMGESDESFVQNITLKQ